ncbi:hypothetical protein [Tuwongella immobilis]|uniref:Uncharacterized protein n=1 Tax=Tuwongella immobilis TaxID=692036 RepID=A0A6C2YKU1_9BACT|nr:hypothetical protein [Tuwongella immobilis]VIP01725.1 Uncharacterized protein OS=Isosphaera pallida (strain ATCC 43644 / DSM 9630 / IS1B) GN=Isop_1006 PE=4 SV=1 [Tuwongella immobilis]VTR99263.1 Uncharacterized protein OS=Isosphaera pallida (strain ATCC 43644 / DSM 9630 / IS1B) GN=Isop_1006 PE=4 SV=1 [Tuwongella immobilis]
MHLNAATLKKLVDFTGPSDAQIRTAVRVLGGLSGLWLSRTARHRADGMTEDSLTQRRLAECQQLLHSELGKCAILLVFSKPLAMLRNAVVLPVRWVKDSAHSSQFPPALHELADRVRHAVFQQWFSPKSGDVPTEPPRWGLHPACSGDWQLQDDLFHGLESAWASLSAGLVAAHLGLLPQMTAFASIALQDGYSQIVEGLTEKMAAACDFGATVFAVDSRQREAAQTAARQFAPSLTIVSAEANDPSLKGVLRSYLPEFTDEPAVPEHVKDAVFQRCVAYYQLFDPRSKRAKTFKHSHLQPVIIRNCRSQFREKIGEGKLTHLVVIVSGSPDLQQLLITATGVSRVLLLHTNDARQTNAAMELQREFPQSCLASFVADDSMPETFCREIAKFTEHVPPEQVGIDVKSGTAKMKYWMGRLAHPENWILNLESAHVDNVAVPGTERVELWRAGVSG